MQSLNRARISWPIVLGFLVIFGPLWLSLFSPPLAPVIPDLGSSWCGALTHFAAQGRQHGRDVVFTYGPLGHLITYVYTSELYRTRIVWEWVSTTIITSILCLAAIRLPTVLRPVFLLFIVLFIWADGISDTLYFLVISCLAAFLFRSGKSSRILNLLTGALLAVFSLLKFTYFLLIVLLLVTVFVFYGKQRRPVPATLLLLSFLGSFLMCWLIAGQSFRHLFLYLSTSWEISLGYKEAMGYPAANNLVVPLGLAAAGLALLFCVLVPIRSRKLSVSCMAVFIAVQTYLSWNRAFVRADDHVLSFFCLCPVALLTIWIAAEPAPAARRIGYASNVLVVLLCLTGMFAQRPALLKNCVSDATVKIRRSLWIAGDPGAHKQRLRLELEAARNAHSLPRTRSEVGDQTIDVFGYEQGIALLNKLNYTPRPIFQGYSAYTPKLVALNTAFYASPNAPDYVLFKYQTIDNRYPALDDAGVLRQLLFNYKPLFEENGYWLWKKAETPAPTKPLSTSTDLLAFDSEHTIKPDGMIWVELDVRPSLAGRLLSLLYRPPFLNIQVTDRQRGKMDYRLVPSMASAGFIISPSLLTSQQILEARAGSRANAIASFSVHVPDNTRSLFQPTINCRMSALPEIPPGNPLWEQ